MFVMRQNLDRFCASIKHQHAEGGPFCQNNIEGYMFTFFEPNERVLRDKQELYALELRYGDGVVDVLEARVNDETLAQRDRSHWRRLLKRLRKQHGRPVRFNTAR